MTCSSLPSPRGSVSSRWSLGSRRRWAGLNGSRSAPAPLAHAKLLYSGALYDASTLERWNVVNRVLPSDTFAQEALTYAQTLANGPTRAHSASKILIRTQTDNGTRAADAITAQTSAPLLRQTTSQTPCAHSSSTAPAGEATYTGR